MRLTLLAVAFLLSFHHQAHSTLGERAQSVEQDQRSLKGRQLKSSSKGSFTVHEMSVDGNSVKEFANSEGIVFAVSWRGVSRPNLETLFGQYHAEYKAEDSKRRRRRGRQAVTVKTPRVVVHHEGHMRDLRGLALLPELMPAGVQPEDLQ